MKDKESTIYIYGELFYKLNGKWYVNKKYFDYIMKQEKSKKEN